MLSKNFRGPNVNVCFEISGYELGPGQEMSPGVIPETVFEGLAPEMAKMPKKKPYAKK